MPSRLDVIATQLDEDLGSGGLEDRVRVGLEDVALHLVHPRRDAPYGVEDSDEHRRVVCDRLADLVERHSRESLDPKRSHVQAQVARCVVPTSVGASTSATMSSASPIQSTHATPVKVSLTAGLNARRAISTT